MKLQSNLAAIKRIFPDLIVKADGTPYKRPAFTDDETIYRHGYYWENCDGDRFYFKTAAECADDVAPEIDLTDKERMF